MTVTQNNFKDYRGFLSKFHYRDYTAISDQHIFSCTKCHAILAYDKIEVTTWKYRIKDIIPLKYDIII
jgi:hypothetical protein